MSDPRCGSTAGYQVHIDAGTTTCQPCRDAQSAWQRHYRTRIYLAGGPMLVDSTGSRRRLRALVRMGWTFDALAARLGVSGSAVRGWTYNTTVRRDTARSVASLYDELWDKHGPSVKTAKRAATKGWPPPLAWDDDTIDDPATKPAAYVPGAPGRPRNTDLDERILELTRAGLSAAEICVRLGTYKRHVTRVRARNRQEGAA